MEILAALFLGSLFFGCQVNKKDSKSSNRQVSNNTPKRQPPKQSNIIICPHCNKPINKLED